MEDQRIKEILIEKDGRFRKLFLEHQEFEQQLDELVVREQPSETEQIQVTELKKRKLQVKDAMQRMINAYRSRIDPIGERH